MRFIDVCIPTEVHEIMKIIGNYLVIVDEGEFSLIVDNYELPIGAFKTALGCGINPDNILKAFEGSTNYVALAKVDKLLADYIVLTAEQTDAVYIYRQFRDVCLGTKSEITNVVRVENAASGWDGVRNAFGAAIDSLRDNTTENVTLINGNGDTAVTSYGRGDVPYSVIVKNNVGNPEQLVASIRESYFVMKSPNDVQYVHSEKMPKRIALYSDIMWGQVLARVSAAQLGVWTSAYKIEDETLVVLSPQISGFMETYPPSGPSAKMGDSSTEQRERLKNDIIHGKLAYKELRALYDCGDIEPQLYITGLKTSYHLVLTHEQAAGVTKDCPKGRIAYASHDLWPTTVRNFSTDSTLKEFMEQYKEFDESFIYLSSVDLDLLKRYSSDTPTAKLADLFK